MKSNKSPDKLSSRPTGLDGENNDDSNEINSGIISAEGGNDNGASTLRALKKKHTNDTARKPSESNKHIL